MFPLFGRASVVSAILPEKTKKLTHSLLQAYFSLCILQNPPFCIEYEVTKSKHKNELPIRNWHERSVSVKNEFLDFFLITL